MEKLVESPYCIPTAIILGTVVFALIRGINRHIKRQDSFTKAGAEKLKEKDRESEVNVGSSGHVLRGWYSRIRRK